MSASQATMSLQLKLEQQQQFVFERDVYQSLLKQSVITLNEALAHIFNDDLDAYQVLAMKLLVTLDYLRGVFVCPAIVAALTHIIGVLQAFYVTCQHRAVIEAAIDTIQYYID